MSVKHKPLKFVISLFVTVSATIFGWQSSKALSIETKTITEQTVEERLTNVRKQLGRTVRESGTNTLPHRNNELEQNNSEIEKTILAWRNYWSNWSDWSNWSNWNQWNQWRNY